MPIEAWHTLKNISQRWEYSHLITRHRLTWLVGSLGVLLITAGIVFTPSFAAAYVKHVEELDARVTNRVLSYQLRAITLGTLAVIASILASRSQTPTDHCRSRYRSVRQALSTPTISSRSIPRICFSTRRRTRRPGDS